MPSRKKSAKPQEGTSAQEVDLPNESPAWPTFPVLGIGASAGGLEALKRFLGAMPENTGLAFVLVPHLDPSHESLMVELLARQTAMPVCEATEEMAIQPNSVYIIPPNKYLAIIDGVLHLSQLPKPAGVQTAIDAFLRSLGEDAREMAIGIILSGTGSHGTQGIQSIKGNGGMTMAQEPDTAEFESMPLNAIATGVIDFILPPEKMPEALIGYVQHANASGVWAPVAPPESELDQLTRVLAVLRARSKYDFRYYRKNMLLRRVQRRMGLCHAETITDYLERIREDPEEVQQLFRDMLIGVTEFFREPEAYNVLEQRVISKLIKAREADAPVRVWVPACATGEEAYSIAILLLEQTEKANRTLDFQVFATDIDEEALEFARQGVYPESIAADVSPERLKRYFTKTDHHYQVNKQVRESVVFAAQNLISDAPFSKLDLVSCRNLLIYLEPEIQRKVISLFHFALKTDGHLFLGSSETVGRHGEMFETLSKKWRVFRRVGPDRRDLADFPIARGADRLGLHVDVATTTEPQAEPALGLVALMQKAILVDFSPAAALIDRRYEVLCVQGPLVDFLEFPSGELSNDLLAMARHGLRTKIRAACLKVMRENQAVVVGDCRVKRNGRHVPCTVTVRPFTRPNDAEGLLLIIFQDSSATTTNEPSLAAAAVDPAEESSVVSHLEFELKSAREDLQSTIEEMESSHEELKASNEEIMSMNEELQSANEELETSKEELQSMNEELTTVNNQLRDKLGEVELTNNDMSNFLANTDVPTVFLDDQLSIKRFTPATTKLLKVIATDIGRSLSIFAGNLGDDTLLEDAQRVLDGLTPIEKNLQTADSQSYIRRIVPYRTQDNRIDGVVITFVDITKHVQDQQALRISEQRLALATEATSAAVWDCDLTTDTVWWNEEYNRLFGERPAATQSSWQWWVDHIHPEDRARVVASIHAALESNDESWSSEYRYQRTDAQFADVIDKARISRDDGGKAVRIIGAMHNITEQKQAEQRLHRAERLASMSTLATGLAHEIKNPLAALVTAAQAALNMKDKPISGDKLGKSLRNVVDSAMRCDTIVSKLRQFVGGQSDAKQACDLNELVRNAADSAQAFCESHHSQIELIPDKALPLTKVNAVEIELLLKNLIYNAAQAGNVKITVRTECAGDRVRLTVQDNGPGISSEAKQRAFEPFYSTRQDQGGMGLGLSIAHGVVVGHQGVIHIDGEIGLGTTVAFELPIEPKVDE